jgi:alpha-N-arabinofuranosidase
MNRLQLFVIALCFGFTVSAKEYHVAKTGNDKSNGALNSPFLTIQTAANVAQPEDIITVHEGIYRERINPPRGGTSEVKRIVYRAAKGEKVIIKGSEEVKGWKKIQNDTWMVKIPNAFFGNFNPYSDVISGDWFRSKDRTHHTGAVYLNGHWLDEAAHKEEVLEAVNGKSLWFAIWWK